MQTPVIFIVFNRPEVTSQVFGRIREARPHVLYVISDGPRADHPDDIPKVAAVRALIENGVDWPCEVIRDFADSNLGCRHRVASGLNNAFARLDRAIVLEDDCLPDPSFFPFCEEMLERYRDDLEIMHVSGTNLASSGKANSYRFSHHPWIWGWATWSRAWQHYDFEMKTWDERHNGLRASFASGWEAQFWISAFDQARADFERLNTWDFPWMFSVRSRAGLCLMPNVNLVSNLGIGTNSTHTGGDSEHLRLASSTLFFPLHSPTNRRVNRFADEKITRVYGRKSDWINALRSRLRILGGYARP